ncbi:hypothetical protein HY229_06250 [Candidatus Acetothermia bacterium]|nr:hypothetical protein [Candidatus Acetothermia bacterium]MBI3643682.1 hypothetical protein [Candidatus Acetothermia bacterium]
MRYQDQAIRMTTKAVDDLFRFAKGTTKDKVAWKPLDQGRSVLEQLQECAQAPSWFTAMLQMKKMPEFPPDMAEKAKKDREQWKTIEACEKACKDTSTKLYEVIKNFPDKDMEISIHLPFGKGFDASMGDIIMFHYWNVVYHQGQVNFIQTLYGDKEMH